MVEFILRHATEADLHEIRTLVRAVRINPSDLDWRRFLLAVTPEGKMIGCGQVKSHQGGTRELASLAVRPAFRHQGVAGAIIDHLLAENPPPLYLMCRSELGVFYEKFGLQSVKSEELPVYFHRMMRLFNTFHLLEILVMVYNGKRSVI